MWQTKYAAAIPKNLGVGVNFWPCSEGYFLSGRPQSLLLCSKIKKDLCKIVTKSLIVTKCNVIISRLNYRFGLLSLSLVSNHKFLRDLFLDHTRFIACMNLPANLPELFDKHRISYLIDQVQALESSVMQQIPFQNSLSSSKKFFTIFYYVKLKERLLFSQKFWKSVEPDQIGVFVTSGQHICSERIAHH